MLLGAGEVVFTGRDEGDLGHGGAWVAVADVDPAVEARRRKVVDRPWSWLRQVHGNRVVVVERPGGGAGEKADALITTEPDTALAILAADCAPVAMAGDNGSLGAAHAGWRGLTAGVLEATADALRATGANHIVATLGPCIHAECYEFSPADLDTVAARLGDGVRATTADGKPALDVPAAVRAALTNANVELVHDAGACTACSPGCFSHRARGERQRQAMVVWRPSPQ